MPIEDIVEAAFEELFEASRWRIVRARIRNGKVQRRKKVSNIKGFTFRKKGGQTRFIRITATEKLRRRMGARRAKIKRRGKKSQIRLKMRRSLRRRRSIGL